MDKLAPKPFVFVLMPFSKAFDDIYTLGIKPACKEAGAYSERVDEQFFEESILDRIYNQTLKSDLIVADMTGRNANVFYETGYAHALGKQVILLTQNVDDIPFDLKQYPHIVYGGVISVLKDKLEKSVKWSLEHPRRPLTIVSDLEFYLRGEKLVDGMMTSLQVIAGSDGTRNLKLIVDIHNACNRVCDTSMLEVGLEMPLEFENASETSTIRLSKNSCLHVWERVGRLLPCGWKSLTLNINVKSFEAIRNHAYNCALHIFSDAGTNAIPFKLQLLPDRGAGYVFT